MKTLLVQMADRAWTEAALHVACAMARSSEDGGTVVLLRMIETQHYSWLGTEFAYGTDTPEASSTLWAYKAIAEKYGVTLCVEPMQWITFVDAMVQAADALDADAVFARVPESSIPLWQRYQTWDLRRQLQGRKRALYTLDKPAHTTATPPELERLAHQH